MERQQPEKIIELDLKKITWQSFYLTIISAVILVVLTILVQGTWNVSITLFNVFLVIIGYIVLIVLHEFFHLLGFRIFCGVPWKRMKAGINVKLGIAYATTDQWMTNKSIRKALLLPFWTTGVIPAIFAILTGNGVLLILAVFLISGAVGDFAMYKELKKLPDDWYVEDDPELPKLYVYKEKIAQ